MTPVVHIGIAKSGTSFLQSRIFEPLPTVYRFGQPYGDPEERRLVWSLKYDDDFDFEKKKFNEMLNYHRIKAEREDKRFVFTDETLTSPVMKSLVAQRIFDVLPDAQILMTIREQKDSINSFYLHNGNHLRDVPEPWVYSPVAFDNWFSYCCENKRGTHIDRINYWKIFSIYSMIFGSEKIWVCPYEYLKDEKFYFAEMFGKLLNESPKTIMNLCSQKPENSRIGNTDKLLAGFENRLVKRPPLLTKLPLSCGQKDFGKKIIRKFKMRKVETDLVVPEDITEKINNMFCDENKKLSDFLKLDLRSLGYFT